MLVTVGKFKNAKAKKGGGSGLELGGVQMLGTGAGEGGGGAEADPFKRIGLNAKKLATLKPDDQLKAIADGMKQLKTQADRAAVAQAIFGKGAVQLLPFLSEGSAGIDKLSAAANKFGGVMSDDAVRAADEADHAMIDAKMAIAGLTTTLSVSFLPVATKAFKTFSEWVSNNRGQIQAWAQSTAKWIEGKGIPTLLKIGEAVKTITEKVSAFIDKIGTGNVAIGLAAVRLAPLAKTLLEINGALIKATMSWGSFAKASQNGGEGGAPSAIGKIIGKAASVALVAEAAMVGYAIGTAIDEKVGASDWAAKLIGKVSGQQETLNAIEQAGVDSNNFRNQTRQLQINSLQQDFMKQGMSRGQALHAAEQQIVYGNKAMPSTAGAGGGAPVTVAPVVHIGTDATRGDVSKGMDDAKRKTLEAFDKRAAYRRRVTYAE
jgi:hypothetical protein